MKNIYEILKDFGLEIPEEKKADFDKAWKENYRTKAEYDKAVSQRDTYKTSLEDVSGKLKEFDGIDVADLKGQIQQLKTDLENKDAEYANKEAERVFDEALKAAIKEAGGRNEKAVLSLLDVETLKASKNQASDIEKALGEIKKTDAYLFGENEPFYNPVGNIGGQGGDPLKGGDIASIRAAMGLPAEK